MELAVHLHADAIPLNRQNAIFRIVCKERIAGNLVERAEQQKLLAVSEIAP